MKSLSLAAVLFALMAVTWPPAAYAAPPPESVAASSQVQPAPVTSSSADPSSQAQPAPAVPTTGESPAKSPELPAASAEPKGKSEDLGGEYKEEPQGEQAPAIADPIEPFNRAMFEFNDKLYFWLLKPVAQGYKVVVPEEARVSVKNFFSNMGFPIRFVSCLLQADVNCAATEVGRF